MRIVYKLPFTRFTLKKVTNLVYSYRYLLCSF